MKKSSSVYAGEYFFESFAGIRGLSEKQKIKINLLKSEMKVGNKNLILMDKLEVLEIVKTIREQLFTMNDMNVLMSWGIEGLIATQYKEKPTLKFKVNGRLFKGYVLISYTYDYYDIFLADSEKTVCIASEITFEEMGDIIDIAIEKGTNEDEYNAFCMEEYKKLYFV